MAARSSAALARQAPSLGAGGLAQLLLAHRFHHLARGAFEARFRALAALGRERGARGDLLLLRSGRREILLATDLRSPFESGICAKKNVHGPEGSGGIALARRAPIVPAPRSPARSCARLAPGSRRAGAARTWHWRAKSRRRPRR